MKLGYLYRIRKDATQDGHPVKRFFCFGNDTGRFIGYTPGGNWPRFSHDKGVESCVNCMNPDDILEEVIE